MVDRRSEGSQETGVRSRELSEVVDRVIRMAEDASGLPVHVTPDETLTVLSSVTIARGDMAGHVVRYNPKVSKRPDYLICYQAGFVVRFFRMPVGERLHLGGSEKGAYWVDRLISQDKGIRQVFRTNRGGARGDRSQKTEVGMRVEGGVRWSAIKSWIWSLAE